ncbi:MAG: tRNA-intron lyase, partial [Candidatus Hydrothermarchaeota archaeon]
MKGLLIDDKVIIESKASISKLEQRGYGKKADDRLELSLIEALFLVERGSLEIKNASFEEILEKAKEEEEFIIKYKVYKDLRSRGYV